MSWKVRHEGSPVAIEGLTLTQVVEGLQDGQWEPTDEVMGPDDREWVAIENHQQLADVALDLEPPPRPAHDDETRLDMNALIDVTLVLLIFFILTTSYAALQKLLDAANVASADPTKPRTFTQEQVDEMMIEVEIQMEGDRPVILVEEEVVREEDLLGVLAGLTRGDRRKTTLVIYCHPDVPHKTVVAVQDKARGAGVLQILRPNHQKERPAKAP